MRTGKWQIIDKEPSDILMSIEDHIDIGDIRIGYATFLHGVEIPIKRPTGGKDGR